MEWQWIEVNPLKNVKKPPTPPHRDRRVTEQEINQILEALNYHPGTPPQTKSHQVTIAWLLALETAMRAGELVNLVWSDVHLDERYVQLEKTKNGTSRQVPLSKQAVELFEILDEMEGDRVFTVTGQVLSATFRKARIRSGIENLTFHDSRHEAITRLAKKLDIYDLSRMTGHKDLRSLMIYYNATATEIAVKLD